MSLEVNPGNDDAGCLLMEWVKMGVTIFGLYDFLLLIIIREGGVKRERERKGRGGRDEKGRKGKPKAIKSSNTPKVKSGLLLPSALQ